MIELTNLIRLDWICDGRQLGFSVETFLTAPKHIIETLSSGLRPREFAGECRLWIYVSVMLDHIASAGLGNASQSKQIKSAV